MFKKGLLLLTERVSSARGHFDAHLFIIKRHSVSEVVDFPRKVAVLAPKCGDITAQFVFRLLGKSTR